MTLRHLEIQDEYRSDRCDLIQDFYVPCLENSSLYCRAVGFFSSTSMVAAAKGLSGLIRSSGKMQLVAFQLRLALSATPERYFDERGTERLFEYFGPVLQPEFTLRDAIAAKALVPYLQRQIARLIPTLADQLVVPALKTQWRGEVETEMEPYVGKEYVLVFNSAKPDCQPDTIELNGDIYPLVRQSPNEFEWTEVVEVVRE